MDIVHLNTPIGNLEIKGNKEGLSSVYFLKTEEETTTKIPNSLKDTVKQLEEYFLGKSVLTAVKNINTIINKNLKNTDSNKQKKIDQHKANKLKAEKKLELDAHNDKLTSSYSAYVMERIEANWNRPPSARRGMQAELIIKLVPTGQVVSVALVKSSGNKAFDRSAEQAVYKADKFDKLQKLDIQIFEKSFRRLHLVFRPDDLRL